MQSVAVMEVSEPGTQELIEPPTSSLPKFVVDGLNDLDRELSEGMLNVGLVFHSQPATCHSYKK